MKKKSLFVFVVLVTFFVFEGSHFVWAQPEQEHTRDDYGSVVVRILDAEGNEPIEEVFKVYLFPDIEYHRLSSDNTYTILTDRKMGTVLDSVTVCLSPLFGLVHNIGGQEKKTRSEGVTSMHGLYGQVCNLSHPAGRPKSIFFQSSTIPIFHHSRFQCTTAPGIQTGTIKPQPES